MWIAADVPTTADWVSAIGQATGSLFTAAAVAVALWLGVRDRRWRRADQAVADAERRDSEAAQARLVTIDVDTYYDYALTPEMVTVLNGSTAPITSVSLVEVTNPEAAWGWDFDSDTPFGDGFTIEPRVIAAGEKFTVPIYFRGEKGGSVASTELTSVTIQFTDVMGLVWRRTDAHLPVRWDPVGDRAILDAPTAPSSPWWVIRRRPR
ncbi:hypothetical protein [Pseudonocardia alni]|uniref:hypothetical protein n=1 Tax=Pseudonocardia alni TaxID=33907 RepID=UPI0033344CE8